MCILVVVLVTILCRYILTEGQRIESQKKFLKNMDEFDAKKVENDKK